MSTPARSRQVISSLSPRLARTVLIGSSWLLLAACAGGAHTSPSESSQAKRLTSRQRAEMTSQCLRDKGWDIKSDPDHPGQLVLPGEGIPESQAGAFSADSTKCDADLGLNKEQPFTVAEAKIMYKHELKTAKCLGSEGYTISSPVSEGVFIKDFTKNPQGAYWNPWAEVPILPPDQMSALEQKCPQGPAEFTG